MLINTEANKSRNLYLGVFDKLCNLLIYLNNIFLYFSLDVGRFSPLYFHGYSFSDRLPLLV